jgi:DEAD/DEAH box helicase domain-containing protein
LEASFVGAYDDKSDKIYSFWEKDLDKLGQMMEQSDRVVGYNIWQFDYLVLNPYFKMDLRDLPTLDLMVAMKDSVGFRPKLDDLARANLGKTKIAKGTDAVDYWNNQELDKLEEYCLEDVRLTYDVWKVGEETGMLKYFDKSGFLKETNIDWTSGFLQNVPDTSQTEMF